MLELAKIWRKIFSASLPQQSSQTVIHEQVIADKTTEKNRLKINELLAGPNPIKLELGAGENRGIDGWTYVDQNETCDLVLDLRQPLPFPDNCIDMLYSSHLLEHFLYPDLIKFLYECHRVLKPRAIFSAAVPNARIYLDAYLKPDDFDPDFFCTWKPAYNFNSKIDYVNYIAYMDGHHHYMFDEQNLPVILNNVGFKFVKLRDFDDVLDLEKRHYESIYVEGTK